MNPAFYTYKKEITHPLKYRWFLLSKLPLAFFAGVKLAGLSETEARLTVPRKWLNKNPFRSVYLAVLTMAAEMSTGVLCMGAVYHRKPTVSMLPVDMRAVFHKKATGKITFTCSDGEKISVAVESAIAAHESRSVLCYSVGRNETGEMVAEFYFTWSFRARV